MLKVICCNVWIGGILFDELLSFFLDEDADLLLLQEVYDGDGRFEKKQHRCLSELKSKLPYKYSAFSPAFYEMVDGKKLNQGNAILSKFPVQEQKTVFYDVEYQERDPDDASKYHVTPRNLQHVTVDINSQTFNVFNTQGIWGTHGGDTKRRIEMAKTIVSALPQKAQKTLLAGDFNVNEDTETIEIIEKKLTNVFKNELETSFNLKNKDLVANPGYVSSVVDMFFVSSDIEISEHYVSQRNVSDHLPLVCEIKI